MKMNVVQWLRIFLLHYKESNDKFQSIIKETKKINMTTPLI